jgi:hypothetical protein
VSTIPAIGTFALYAAQSIFGGFSGLATTLKYQNFVNFLLFNQQKFTHRLKYLSLFVLKAAKLVFWLGGTRSAIAAQLIED